jgi:hypothetical protein
MIAIAIYWLIGAFVFINLGRLVDRILGLKENTLFFTFLNGIFFFLLYFSISSIFIGVYNFAIHLFFAFIIIYSVWSNMEFSYHKISQWLESNSKHPFLFLLLFILFLLLSALPPLLDSNESYYIQTIKWAGEYGLTKGLVNLHPYLGQFSTWHILQAGFNPGVLIFNDINGLLLLLYLSYLLCNVSKVLKKNFLTFDERLFIYYLIVFPFLIPFVNSPSPDLPVIILAQMAFYLFVRNFYHVRREELIQLVVFVLFAAAIKNTAIPLLFLPFIILLKYRRIIKFRYVLYYGFYVFLLVLFLVYKNFIITGYPFFPFSFLGKYISVDWKYPVEVLDKYVNYCRAFIYGGELSSNFITNFYHWLFHPHFIVFLINFIWIILLIFIPLLIANHSHKKALSYIYGMAIIYFLTLFMFNAPYISYFLYFELFFVAILMEKILNLFPIKVNSKWLVTPIIISSFIFLLLHPPNLNMVYNPMEISKYKNYDTKIINNYIINFPIDSKSIWDTGDAFIPAAQPAMMDLLYRSKDDKYKLLIRGGELSKGFKLQKEN